MKLIPLALASSCVLALGLMAMPAGAAPVKVVQYGSSQDKNSGKNDNNKDCKDIQDCKDKDSRSKSAPCDEDHGKSPSKGDDDHGKGNDDKGKGNDKGNDKDNGKGKDGKGY